MKTNVVNIVSEDICVGCCACHDICPVDAIDIIPNKEGFLIPAISQKCTECGMCVKICPAINVKKDNFKKPRCYAFRADDHLREKSSSGGAFSSISTQILKNNGYVCGAAFDDDMILKHIIISSEDNMEKLRGSKYLQSDMAGIYRQIKKILDDGHLLLYSGCPCQVAALYSYLGKKYEKLYTIDVMCHGVPSQKLFSKYLDEISDKKVTDVKFKSKEKGWTSEFIKIIYYDDSYYFKSRREGDPYVSAFLRNLSLRVSCSDCIFSTFPRHGDISLGDFWGISKIDPKQQDGLGTSMVLINNERGAKLINKIDKTNVKMSSIPYEKYITAPNRFNREYAANKNRNDFFESIENGNSFYSSVFSSISNKENQIREGVREGVYDIGLVSNYLAGNFGGSLTQYALYRVLSDMGYNVLMIERPQSSKSDTNRNILNKIYLKSPYPENCLSKPYRNKKEMRKLNNICTSFVVGSDQLFQYSLYSEIDRFVNLEWVDGPKKKIAYAASFGHESIWGDQDTHSELGYFLKRFDAFSVRETSGVDICRREYGIEAEWVLDPVFLCDMKHYDNLIRESDRIINKKVKISAYILDPSDKKRDIIQNMEKNLAYKSEVFSELGYSEKYISPLKGLNVVQLKVEERLQSIQNCDFFITDSFHGTCFAILMKKQFISIINHNRGAGRFRSLLPLLGLEDRMFEEDVNLEILNDLAPIDYEEVYIRLNLEKEKCLSWLSQNLSSQKSKSFDNYDMIREIKDQYERLIREINANQFSRITEIETYLYSLEHNRENLVIIISVKDTPGLNLGDSIQNKLFSLGVLTDLRIKHQQSYIFISDGLETVFDQSSIDKETVKYVGTVNGLKVDVASSSFRTQNFSSIIIDGVEHSVDRRGLNIVVIDKKDGAIRDSVCFDTHSRNLNCHRV